jgi:hypothetical protein
LVSNEPPAIAPNGQDGERDRAQRMNLLLAASIEAANINAPVRIRNLSESGAMIEGTTLPPLGTQLVLRRLQLEIGGTVVWSSHSRCGVRFADTISVAGWRSGTWIAPARSEQARVDSIQSGIRAGMAPTSASPAAPAAIAPPNVAEPLATDIDGLVAEELCALRHMLENVGEQLSEDPVIVQHYPATLQSFDLACQTLGHLAAVLRAENRSSAIAAVGIEELRQRLQRKSSPAG